MKFAATLVAALAIAATQVNGLTWTDCSGNTVPDISNQVFNMDGEWNCVGQRTCGTLSGNLIYPITEGATLDVVVKYLGRVTGSYNGNLCSILAESGVNCPIAPGPKTFHACIDYGGINTDIPTVATVSSSNGNGHLLFCQTSK
ncbi:hypothetical protein FBU30_006517 [Linnemannia zychae]|nr:hypothetical protein FBU30_006517 [Linnemannia zychae]